MQYTSTDSGSPVNWGSDITALADALLEQLAAAGRSGNDPMKKICVVVNSPATERWLKQYFLLDRRTSQLLFNLEFVKLPEFVNDWLWAVVEGRAPRERRATRHPYSKDVMTWRIYRLLGQMRSGEGFDELLDYIAGDVRRRSALAEKLAILYDDYLNCRLNPDNIHFGCCADGKRIMLPGATSRNGRSRCTKSWSGKTRTLMPRNTSSRSGKIRTGPAGRTPAASRNIWRCTYSTSRSSPNRH